MNRLSRFALSTLVALTLSGTALADAPKIEVVKAGENATSVLRYAPAVGSSETLSLVIDTKKGTDMGGDGKETDLPPFTFDLVGKVTAVEADGRIRYTLTVRRSKLLPQNNNIDLSAAKKAEVDALLAQVEGKLAAIEGATGEVEVSPQGFILSSTFTPSKAGEGTQFDDLTKALSISRVTFPSTPVGVGAKWTVQEPITERGLKVHQTTTHVLTALDGNKATVKSTIVRKGDHDSLQMKKALPAGTVVTLAALASGGEGETLVELDHLFPASGAVSDSHESRVAINKQNEGVMQIGNIESLELDLTRK